METPSLVYTVPADGEFGLEPVTKAAWGGGGGGFLVCWVREGGVGDFVGVGGRGKGVGWVVHALNWVGRYPLRVGDGVKLV